MAPIRRYLRISKYSVLECRIYLDNPSDSRWLLNPRDPVLPRVFDAIRPLVLPKVREENIRLWTKKKGKPVKDVITEDEFEVAIFLRESRTRHSLLTRQKTFDEPEKKDTGADESGNNVIGSSAGPADAEVIIESDDEAMVDLQQIPQASEEDNAGEPKRSSGRRRARKPKANDEDTTDEKKLGFSTHYESFKTYNWVLCLLITRKGDRARKNAATEEPKQPLMEEWISTQAQTAIDED